MIKFNELSTIILYADESTPNLDLIEIKKYLLVHLKNIEIKIRNDFINFHFNSNLSLTNHLNDLDLAESLANTRIRDLMDPKRKISPLRGEVAFEKKTFSKPNKQIPGIFYEGFKLPNLYQTLIPSSEIIRSICHIVFTPRLFGTFDRFDRRYHARVILCGYPSLISTSGIVEAPAKPKDYYKIKMSLFNHKIHNVDQFITNELKTRYLKHNDSKITHILTGYVMQVVFYHLIAEPFCDDEQCRLYNAHWQEELIKAQLGFPEFCEKHDGLLKEYNRIFK